MDITIQPGTLRGEITMIPSKSQGHRLLICAALADKPTQIVCPQTNRDMEATADCLRSLGTQILRTDSGYTVFPVTSLPESAVLNCCESGSTLRFMLPIVGSLGVDATFQMAGRLPQRPLSPLREEMERMGCKLTRPTADTLHCTGKLQPGTYTIDGGVSSQFITGLLFASALLDGDSNIQITGKLESKPYVDMTLDALSRFGIKTDGLSIPGNQKFRSPGFLEVEGDWSNGAFFVTAAALGSELTIHGLDPNSTQGDRTIVELLAQLRSSMPTVSAADIPDLVPILSVAAAANHGAVFIDIHRLRLKESDRVASVIAMLESLGGKATSDENTLTVYGTGLTGGKVDCANDHRIAMSAAIASTVCDHPVTLLGADAVNKSYPLFWEEFTRLGGKYELYLR